MKTNLYKEFWQQSVLKGLNIKLILIVLVLSFYIFSDLFFRQNIFAFYTRILPISLALFLLILHNATKVSVALRAWLYIAILSSTPIMMYAKCMIHVHDGLASCVSGTILVVFLVSFDFKATSKYAYILYVAPALVFFILLYTLFDLSKEELLITFNLPPIILMGIAVNRIQEKLRFTNFIQNYQLSEQKKELTKQAEKLKELNKTKDKFFTIIAHDLRNPISAILGYTNLINNHGASMTTTEFMAYSHRMHKSAEQSFTLLNNLVQWSMLQTNRINFHPKYIDIHKQLNNIFTLYESQIKQKKIELINNCPEYIGAFVDENMFDTILRNLTSNAIKYTPKNGRIKFNCINTDSAFELTISDSGIGMEQEKIECLFNISEVQSTKGTNGEQGTGIGLTLCKEFIEEHNGEIKIESELEKGTSITITIPQNN